MLRGCFIAKYGVIRISGNSIVQSSSKWLSVVAGNNAPQVNGPKTAEKPTGEPAWVRTAIDKKIFAASDIKSLSAVIESKEFNSNAAVTMINVLGNWITAGKFSVSDFQRLDQRGKIEDQLLRGNFNIGISSTLQGIKSLFALGFPANSKVVSSLENEILWLLRKVTIRQHFQIIEFHINIQETEMQQKVIREAVSNIQRRWVEIIDAKDFASLFKLASHFSPKFVEKMEDILVELVETYSQADRTVILVALGACQRRSTPLLRALSYHMNKTTDPLPIRMSSDVLYALNRLSFHDQALIERICNDLVPQLTPDIKSPLVGSILTSLGHLKYRHEGALDALCEWVNQNWSNVRRQEVVSLLISMATVDFLPSNWELLWPKITEILKQEQQSQTWSESVALDVAWSLAVLNHLNQPVVQSVLNDSFVSKVLSKAGTNEKGVKLKLNQIWAVSTLKSIGTNNLTIKMPFNLTDSSTNVKPPALQQAVTGALGHFIPIGKYLRLNSMTSLGVEVEGECILNDQCVPLPIADYDNSQKAIPVNAYRVAILVQDYKDLCKGRLLSNGAQGLRERILIQSGYRVVKVRHNEFDPKDKIVKQLQFLEQLIKSALNHSTQW